jgi:hypothetical protein
MIASNRGSEHLNGYLNSCTGDGVQDDVDEGAELSPGMGDS